MTHSLTAQPGDIPAERPVTVGQVTGALRRRWRWVAAPVLLALAASGAFVALATPRYTGEARLILEPRDGFYTRPDKERTADPLIDEQAVASQVQVILSRDLARESIKRLGLVGNPEFDPASGEIGAVRRVLILLGVAKNPFDRPPEDRLFENWYENLKVFAVGKSRIVAIEFRSRDPELAARAANTVAEVYLEGQEAAKKDTARSASTWLGSTIEGLRARVEEAEAKVEAFRSRSGLLMGALNSTVPSQHLAELNTQLAAARTAQADSQAKAKLIRDLIRTGRLFEIPDVANNELIRRLIEQRVTLRAQIALESRTLLPAHPRLKELGAQIADLEGQIRGAAERTVRTLENDARIAGSRLETLQAAIDAQSRVVSTANESEVQLRALEREAKAQREQLESYLARYREAMARDSRNAAPADARIVSRAVVPDRPSFPKPLPTVALAVLAALLLSAGAIAARVLLAAPPAPPRREPDAAFDQQLAAVPRPAPRPVAFEASPMPTPAAPPAPPAGEEVPIEPAAAPPAPAEAPIPVPAAAPSDYLSGLIARLSRAAPAERGRRVLVVGLESPWRARRLAGELGRALSAEAPAILVRLDEPGPVRRPGFADLVAGDAAFADVIVRETQSRLHVVEAGAVEGLALADEEDGVEIALTAFDQTYDWVIALAHRPDPALAGIMAERVDAVVIASADEATSERLVDLYELARGPGVADVVVVRELGAVAAVAA
ncbi:MAG TPA: GumC family protein [Salinarimonas sp.]|nr:GumC family protein [Salinarimonas sp.]